MEDGGYDKEFSVAVTSASSTIGPIFPPSIPMLVFSLVSGVSVGKLFLGGVIPGLIMTGTLMMMVGWYAHKNHYPRCPLITVGMFVRGLAEAFLPLMTPVILLGGIWTGFFTPTEAAAVAVAYALLIGLLVFREIGVKELIQIFIDTAKETAVIGFIVSGAAFYGWILMRSGLTIKLAERITGFSANPLVILLVINIFLLIIGCFLDPTVAILILGPVLMPVITRVGIDPVHFGVVMVLNLMIGLLTPPFGVVLFVMAQISGLSFAQVVKSTLPFLIPLLVVLLLLIIFPGLVTVLPNFFIRM